MLTYAATVPANLTATERANYAALLAFATGSGQTTGTGIGQLPAGYVPLPHNLRATDAAVIKAILKPGTTVPPTTNNPPPTSTGPDTQPIPSSNPTPTGSGTTTPSSTPSTPTTTKTKTPPVTHPKAQPAKSLLTKLIGAGAARFAVPVVAGLGFTALAAAPFVGGRRRRNLAAFHTGAIAWLTRARERSRHRNVFDPW